MRLGVQNTLYLRALDQNGDILDSDDLNVGIQAQDASEFSQYDVSLLANDGAFALRLIPDTLRQIESK